MPDHRFPSADPDSDDAPGHVPEDAAEADLWFLPGPFEEDEADSLAMPGPRADRRQVFDLPVWAAAGAALAPDLAALAFAFGRLDERLRLMGTGARHRLALEEVSALGWWTGDRLTTDRIGLWMALRAGAAGEDAPKLALAAWAVRRLLATFPAGGDSDEARWQAAISGFLGREGAGHDPAGSLAEAAEALAGVLAQTPGFDPLIRAAVAFHLWRSVASGPACDTEAAVLAARIGATAAPGAGFLPLMLAGVRAPAATGTPEARLAAWISGAHQAVLAALLRLERLAEWERQAAGATGDLSGRTPPRLAQAFLRWPMLSAPMAERETGASRAAVQRNIDMFAGLGLIREVTGQGRFRLWTVRAGGR